MKQKLAGQELNVKIRCSVVLLKLSILGGIEMYDVDRTVILYLFEKEDG